MRPILTCSEVDHNQNTFASRYDPSVNPSLAREARAEGVQMSDGCAAPSHQARKARRATMDKQLAAVAGTESVQVRTQ